jgi:hypothetical protein
MTLITYAHFQAVYAYDGMCDANLSVPFSMISVFVRSIRENGALRGVQTPQVLIYKH